MLGAHSKAPPVSPAENESAPLSSTASHHRLLFVDDDADVRTAFAKAAGTAGIDVDLAASGQQALRMAQSHDYPVVATDLRNQWAYLLDDAERLAVYFELHGRVSDEAGGSCGASDSFRSRGSFSGRGRSSFSAGSSDSDRSSFSSSDSY